MTLTTLLLRAASVSALLLCNAACDDASHYPPPPTRWTKVLDAAPWGARDAGATVVHRGEAWILGGWTYENKRSRLLSDAWASDDGLKWRSVKLPTPYDMYPMAASYGGEILYMGGLKGSRQPDESISNAIWSSPDGAQWTQRVAAAEWEPRIGASLVTHQGQLWILGGKVRNSGDPAVFRNDVWRSSDGLHWTRVVVQAPWPARAFHCAVSYHDRLWVIGGGDWDSKIGRSDVWSSADGVNWKQHADGPWEGRIWHSCFSAGGALRLLGGRLFSPIRTVDEFWSTSDGEQWTKAADSVRPEPRHAAYVAEFPNRVWVIGGSAHGHLHADVWEFRAP